MVGTSCRLPGGVDSASALWRGLVDGRDLVAGSEPGDRWSEEAPVLPSTEDSRALRWGAFLKDIAGFDPAFFGIAPKEAAIMDPQHRLLLEVSWEALEHAGLPPRRMGGSRTGVFMGICPMGYSRRSTDPAEADLYHLLGNTHSTAAARIAYLLGMRGPSFTVDAACASALLSVHLACQSLAAGESDFALAGGVHLNMEWGVSVGFMRAGMLSPTGRCHSFDSRADGYVRSEGVGVVVLKRLADAERDGDRVLAVIRGSAVNHVGRSRGIMMPSTEAQREVAHEALLRAGVAPGQVGLIETHGTGTPVGDPVEFKALASIYGAGEGRCALGAVKTNVGHAEGAAGIVGFIKAVMAVHEGFVPPNLHFQEWNKNISPEQTRFFVPTRVEPWPVRGERRLAAVCSYGFNGSNVHAVLEEAPSREEPSLDGPTGDEASVRLFLLSAGSPAALVSMATRVSSWLTDIGSDTPLEDIAHTLAVRRSHEAHRAVVMADSRGELLTGLSAVMTGTAASGVMKGKVEQTLHPVWVFSGHGSQWAGMGRSLLDQDKDFTRVIDALEPIALQEAGLSLRGLLTSGEAVERADHVQPLLYAMQMALASMWLAHGVRPAAVVGHSLGEIAAAVIAGMLTPEQGMVVACVRARLLHRVSGGAMAVVGLPEKQVLEELARENSTGVSISVVTSLTSTVVAGDPAEVRRLMAKWEGQGIFVRTVAIPVATHTPQVEPILGELTEALASLRPSPARIPFYSTALESPRSPAACDGAYWAANVRNPVRFAHATEALLADGQTLFVELSPHPMLTTSIEEMAETLSHGVRVLPTLLRGQPETATFHAQLAALHCAGGEVDWSALYPEGKLVDLPSTTWERKRYWIERQRPDALSHSAAHPFLGAYVQNPDPESPDGTCHVWHGDLGTGAHPWLADHRIQGFPALPGACYIEMAIAAACEIFDCPPERVRLTGIEIPQMLPLAERVEIHSRASSRRGRIQFEVLTHGTSGTWVCHARAQLHRIGDDEVTPPLAPITGLSEEPTPDERKPESFYRTMSQLGLHCGPAFTGITRILSGADAEHERIVRIELPPEAHTRRGGFGVHPVLLDCCVQSVAISGLEKAADGDGTLWLPASLGKLVIHGDLSRLAWCHTRVDLLDERTLSSRIQMLDSEGAVLGVLEGVRLMRAESRRATSTLNERLFQLSWQEAPLPESGTAPSPGRWLLLAEEGGKAFAEGISRELQARGSHGEVLALEPSWDGARLVAAVRERFASTAGATYQGCVFCAAPTPDTDHGLNRLCQLVELARAHVEGLNLPRFWWVTQGARTVLPDDPGRPDQAALRGLSRTLAYEHPELRTTLVDADSSVDPRHLAEELLADTREDEIVWRGGVRHVARLIRAPLSPAERLPPRSVSVHYGKDAFHLVSDGSGTLDGLHLEARARRPPGEGEVEIQTLATTVHFRDVMIALNLYPTEDGVQPPVGSDCAGVVTAVGAGVTHLRPGDRIVAFSKQVASFCTLPAFVVAKIPDTLEMADAATLPLTYGTAWYGLRRAARLSAGETVLIHSAASGVGLAAVAMARWMGARVLATAGQEHKRVYLREQGVEHVMDSRTLAFADEVRQLTGGRGVDVVLNSLAGESLRASLELLAPFGRFVEIGKRDLFADSKIGLGAFRRSASFTSFDLSAVDNATAQEMLAEVTSEASLSHLPPLPHRTFPLKDAAEAFRLMAKGEHIGRLVLMLPEQGLEQVRPASGSSRVARADGSYVISGGLGGLGLELTRWLVEQGAGRVVLNGRSAPSEKAVQMLDGLRSRGTEIEVVLGDVADPGTAERLVAAATAGGRALRGVLHAAAVLDDAPTAHLDASRVARVWRPKVSGAWNLHQASLGHDLDWWVAFSSQSSLVGNPGQGNYAAANAWLDAFVTWRRKQGLPALAINWGPWGEVGLAQGFKERGFTTIGTQEGLEALESLLVHGRVSTGMFPLDFGMFSQVMPEAAGSPFFASLRDAASREGGAETSLDASLLEKFRTAAPGRQRQLLIQSHLLSLLGSVLRIESSLLSPNTPFVNQGMDSLMGVQLRNRVRASLGVDIPLNAVWTHPDPAKLAVYLETLVGERINAS